MKDVARKALQHPAPPHYRCTVGVFLFCGLLVVGLAGARSAAATTFFVRTGGNDANDGLTPATAFASIRQAGSFLLNAGDRVVVGSGDYHEGNIEPRRGGADGAPVVFIADTTGALTGEPAGPVRVLPDGSTDQTTGFIVFGKRHVRIEGFTIVGAIDAGIQVRPSAQVGGSSADIAIVANVVTNNRYGIQVRAAAPVVITDNEASGNQTGIRIDGEIGSTTDATITGNHLTGNGILALGVHHARFENNALERSGVRISGGDDLSFVQNTMHGSGMILKDGPAHVMVSDNLMEDCGGIQGIVVGSAIIAQNRFHRLSLGISIGTYSAALTPITIEDNEFVGGYVISSSGSTVAMRNNVVSGYFGDVQATATIRADVVANQLAAGGLSIRAPQITVQANQLSAPRRATLSGDIVLLDANRIEGAMGPVSIINGTDVDVTNNQIDGPGAGLWYRARQERRGRVRFAANTVQSGGRAILVGALSATPAVDVVVTGNQLTGSAKTAISVVTIGSAEITENQVTQPGGDGISLQLDRNQSTALVTGNTITGGYDAIAVDGARSATLRNNTINAPAEFGCLVRNTDSVDIDTNQVHGSGNDAINVAGDAILLGDCDRDGTVTADEIDRALQRLFDADVAAYCSALGPNRNGEVSVNSFIAALNNAAETPAGRQPSGQVDIHDNVLEETGGVGILAYAADRLTIQGNAIRKSNHTGVSATGTPSASLILQANTIADSGDDCVLVSGGAAAQLTGNAASTCGGSGVRIRDTGDVAFDGNQVSVTAETAVLATRVASWRSSGNSISDGAGGIALIGGQTYLYGANSYIELNSPSAILDGERVERSNGIGVLVDRTYLVAVSQCEVLDSALDSIAVRRGDDVHEVQILDNTLTNAGASGVTLGTAAEPVGSEDITLDGNQIAGFHTTGIDVYPIGRLLVLGNEIHGMPSNTGAGVYVQYPANSDGVLDVAGNRIRAGLADGIYVENAARAFVWDNVVFSSAQNGVLVRHTARTEVVNTLAYANAQQGILLDQPGAAHVSNNTLYQNGLWGLASFGASHLFLANNILDGNASGSVMLEATDPATIDERFNLTTGPYVGLTPADSDIFDDPRFVDPDGADNILGGDGADDDDFHLSTGNASDASPAIDAGSNTAEVLGISGSATGDGQPDTGPVDLGYHSDASPRVP